jgi:hypothetical protein
LSAQEVFQPELVVLQDSRSVGRQGAATVDAAGPEALGIGGVDQLVVVELVGEVDLGRVAVFLDALVEVGAGRARDLGPA